MSNLTELHRPLAPILRSLLAGIRWPHTGVVLDLACGDCSKWPLYREVLGDRVQLIGVDHSIDAIRSADGDTPGRPVPMSDQGLEGLPDHTGSSPHAPSMSRLFQSLHQWFPRHQGGCRWPVVGDAHGLPLASASIDAGICVAAFGLFENHQHALAELHRVLKPNAPMLLITAEQRWAQVVRWPPALAERLETALTHITLPDAIDDITGDLALLLRSAHLSVPRQQAFLFEAGLPPHAAELAMQPWHTARPLLKAYLTERDLAECDALAARETIDLCSIVLACVGTRA